jgi:pimeloyl-ACP methyl ester carboxylesterase
MAKPSAKNLADYITPLRMNGLKGRMLYLPAPKNKNKEILMVYGLHASIERMFGFAEDLNQYGAVAIPDLPGFGGMDSFYSIGEKPTLDNLADYLASFVKLRYKRKRVTILAMSYGFVVATRMLQKHPELTKKVDLIVSLVGFVHHNDFHMRKTDFYMLKFVAWFGLHRVPAFLIKTLVFRGPPIRATYRLVAKNHRKMHDANKEELERRINFEVGLWKMNDVRTKGQVVFDMLRVNLCDHQVRLPVYHVAIADDHFFNNHVVEQHMRVIYKDFEGISAKIDGKHAPTVIADAKSAAPYVPKKLRQLLAEQK